VFKFIVPYLLVCAGQVAEQSQSPAYTTQAAQDTEDLYLRATEVVDKLRAVVYTIQEEIRAIEKEIRKKQINTRRPGALGRYLPNYDNPPTNTVVFRNSFFGDIHSGQYFLLIAQSDVVMPETALELTDYVHVTCSNIKSTIVHFDSTQGEFRIQIHSYDYDLTRSLKVLSVPTLEIRMRLRDMDPHTPFTLNLENISKLFGEHIIRSTHGQTLAKPKPNFSQKVFCSELLISLAKSIEYKIT